MLFMANVCAKIVDFRGFDSSRVLMLKVGILMFIGDLPETSSQRIVAGIILVGRLGALVWIRRVLELSLLGRASGQILVPRGGFVQN